MRGTGEQFKYKEDVMITTKRTTVDAPEETRKNKAKKIKKFGAFDKADRRNSKRQLKQY